MKTRSTHTIRSTRTRRARPGARYRFTRGLILVALAAVAANGSRGNLLPNGAFEEGEGLGPDGWTRPLEVIARWEPQGTGRRGGRCVMVGSAAEHGSSWGSDPIPIDPDRTYRLTGWVKTEGADGDTQIRIGWYGGDGWWIHTDRAEPLNGDHPWTKLSVTAQPPENARAARLFGGRRYESEAGTSWFDDVVFVAVDGPSELRARRPVQPPRWDVQHPVDTVSDVTATRRNHAPNPFFGEGENDWPNGWSVLNPDAGDFDWEIESTDAGKRGALVMTHTMLRDAGWISDPIPIRPGTVYILAARVRQENAYHVRIGLDWRNDAGESLGASLGPRTPPETEDPRMIHLSATAPEQAVSARILLLQQRSSGTTRVDRVWLGPAK